MFKYLKLYITTLIVIICLPFTLAYNSNDLVGSALEYEVDYKDFMSFFQDGNILALIIGVILSTIYYFSRSRIVKNVRIILLTFIITLLGSSVIFMIFGKGYAGVAPWIVIIGFPLIFVIIFIILPYLLICMLVKLIRYQNFKQSLVFVKDLFFKGVGTIPIAILIALIAFWGINILAKEWNLSQCERYVQSQWAGDFYQVPDLMFRWEAEHALQWGEGAKRKKEEYDKNYNIDFDDIEQKVKPDDSSKILYDVLWKTESFKHPFNILKQRGWIILHGESGARLFISPNKAKGYIHAKSGGDINVKDFHSCFPQASIANITSFYEIGGYDNVIVITTEDNNTTKLYLRELNYMNDKFVSLKDSILALPDSQITNIIPADYEIYTLNKDYYDETEVLRFPTDTISQIVYEGEIIRVRFKNPEAKDKVYTYNCMMFVNNDFESGETRLRRF